MQIEIADLQKFQKIKKSEIRNLLKKVLKDEGYDAELSVALVDDEKIKELNKKYLGKDYVTDVLAFHLDDDDDKSRGKICGEIIVSVQTAVSVAERLNSHVVSEVYLYLIHGILHLIGYDDKDDKLAEVMHKKEKDILAALGYAVSI